MLIKNGRKQSNLVKSHELICPFIILYLVPLPPYLFRLMMNMSSGDPNKHDFSWKNKLSVVPLVSILTIISKLCLLATWIILSNILLSLTADSAPGDCQRSSSNVSIDVFNCPFQFVWSRLHHGVSCSSKISYFLIFHDSDIASFKSDSITLVYGSCHVRSVLIGTEYRNWRQTLDVYLLFTILLGQTY